MKKWLATVLMLMACVVHAQTGVPFNTFVTNQPAAITPLTGNELVPIIQGSSTKHVPVSSIGGTITGVTAGIGLSGGGTAGNVTVNLTTPISNAYLPTATSSSAGIVKPDNSTITITNGVITSTTGGTINFQQATCLNSAGDGAIIQTAVNTGKAVYIKGPCVLDSSVTFNTPSQLIYGLGANVTNLNVPSSAVGTFGSGVFIIATGNPGPGPIFQDFAMNFQQGNTAVQGTRDTNLIAYPPAFYGQNQTRVTMYRVKVSAAMIGVDARGNSGGWIIDDFKESALSVGIWFDGAGDTNRINNWHFWPFGNPNAGGSYGGELTASQEAIWFQPNVGCSTNPTSAPQTTSGTAGAIGLMSGNNFLHLSNSLTIGGLGYCFYNGTGAYGGSAGVTLGEIVNVDFDGGCAPCAGGGLSAGYTNAMMVQNGALQISSTVCTILGSGNFCLYQNGGEVTWGNSNFQNLHGISTPIVHLTGGPSGFGGGSVATLNLGNDIFDQNATTVPAIVSDNINGNGVITLTGNYFNVAASTYSYPVVHAVGSGTIIKAINNNFTAGNGTSNAIAVDTDNWNMVMGNSAPGWNMSFPATVTTGIYACNNSASSTACGAAGGITATGSISTGDLMTWGNNAGTLATDSLIHVSGQAMTNVAQVVFSATSPNATIDATLSTPSVASILLPNATNSSIGRIKYAGTTNLNLIYGNTSGSSNVIYLGDTSASGITLNNNVIPANPSYTIGNGSFPFASIFGGTVNTSNLVGLTTNTITNSGGGTTNFLRADGTWASPISGAVTSVSGSGNITCSPTTGSVVCNMASSPTFQNVIIGTANNISDTSGNILVGISGGAVYLGNVGGNSFSQGNFIPRSSGVYNLGGSGNSWNAVFSNSYYGGGVVGVSCSGPPTSSFAVNAGIVTHC